ncbi:MAG: universal stress protein [Thermoanaerobaculales bacterium]|jgi:nucleotide-binding universal stress UspA family protein|nr:universal stress protein [Thermoanaerobaculales bacterium]
MKNTPKRMLVPTDFSPASNRVLSLAKKMASRFDAEIHLLHDLVVLATKGLSGLSHVVLGSVAERAVRLSKVPVLKVRGS